MKKKQEAILRNIFKNVNFSDKKSSNKKKKLFECCVTNNSFYGFLKI